MTTPVTSRPVRITSLWFCRFLTLLILTLAAQAAPKWGPINKEELAQQIPKLDPDAGVEIILRDVEMDHSSWEEAEDTYYVRAKIFSQRGVEEFSKIDLYYDEDASINYISARTIKPDGTVIELNPDDIFDREIYKSSGTREKTKSFAPPGLVPGAIVEFRYTMRIAGSVIYTPIFFGSSHPTRLVRYKLKLLDLPLGRWAARILSFNCLKQQLNADINGYFLLEMSNLPAAKDEPFQPPPINIRPSAVVYYALKNKERKQKEYWGWFGKELHEKLESATKPTQAITTALAGIIAQSDNDTDKLRKIHDFCRTKIKNRHSDASGLSERQRTKLKENESTTGTLKSGFGTRENINTLFAALARAAGFDPRFVACNDCTKVLFNPALTEGPYVLPDVAIAVKIKDQWLYADPGSIYLAFGVLPWENTEATILISDPNGKAEPVSLIGQPAEASCLNRKADLRLNADGSLEGDVTETYTGYRESQLKQTLDAKTPTKREKYIREEIQVNQKLAEVTNLVIENAASPSEALKISYHLRIPEYADRTDSRLFYQPAVFQKGAAPWFESATRRTAIMFNYRFTTNDEIRITPPERYSLEEASAPKNIDLGPLGECKTSIAVNRKNRAITYRRSFKLTGIAFASSSYQAIKAAFETVNKNDAHTLVLKLCEPPPPARSSPAPIPAEPEAI